MSNTLSTCFQQYIHLSRYARWLEDMKRRETWSETVGRYFDFFVHELSERFGYDVPDELRRELEDAVLGLEIMPSMRALMTAGPALKRDNIAGFNCSFVVVDHPRAFDEIVYILMCGTGVGFSCERQSVSQLPDVPDEFHPADTVIKVRDSKLGWAKAYRQLIALLYAGELPDWDVSNIRPAGERLKTFGGRASGPDPLVDLFQFTIDKFKGAAGRKLTSIEVHDIVCKIGDVVVVGGVRRSALISLSNLSDDRMRDAKSGEWWNANPQRRLANNSAAYTERPDVGQFMREWLSLYDSKSGERGIFNRNAATKQCERFGRKTEIAGKPIQFGTNPCGEIILRSMEFCNLTEIVARAGDSQKDIERKARLATILGTWQSALTDYRYIRKGWKNNSEEERLLGVSITGIMDCPLLNQPTKELSSFLASVRELCIVTNEAWAQKLDIPASAAITCVKPSGTVSQLVDSASGIHSRHSEFYIRRVRSDVKDPLTQFMIQQGFPHEVDAMNDQNIVFEFPVRSPDSVTRNERGALEELELWLIYKRDWCQHNPSVTISVREEEWPSVGAWVWDHFYDIGGVSFLPYDGGTYRQAPYEEVDEDTLSELEERMPVDVDWSLLMEEDDETTGSQELACVGGMCEI